MTTLTIYMRSGNRIKLRYVKDWNATVNGNSVTRLAITRNSLAEFLSHEKLLVQSIDLTQIEAITTT